MTELLLWLEWYFCVVVTVYLISCCLLLQIVSRCLSASEVGHTANLPLLQQLLNCVTTITTASGPDCHLHSAVLFSVLLRISASQHSVVLKAQVHMLSQYPLKTSDLCMISDKSIDFKCFVTRDGEGLRRHGLVF